jgi:hypothetical protein
MSQLSAVSKVRKHPSKNEQLLAAASNGNLPKVIELLAKGADPSFVDPSTSRSVVSEAIFEDRKDVVAHLLGENLSPGVLDDALSVAARCCSLDVVHRILDLGGQIRFDIEDPEFFRWARAFGNDVGADATQRVLRAHLMAGSLDRALDIGCGVAPSRGSSDFGVL